MTNPCVEQIPLSYEDPLLRLSSFCRGPKACALLSDATDEGRLSLLIPHLEDIGHGQGLPSLGNVRVYSFEAGAQFQEIFLPRLCLAGQTWPDLIVLSYPAAMVFDHEKQSLHAVAVGATPNDAKARAQKLATAYLACDVAKNDFETPLADHFIPIQSDQDHRQKISRLVSKITAGELFQANLCMHYQGNLRDFLSPIDVFSRLSSQSKAPFSSFLRYDCFALVSNSPERFVRSDKDGALITQPIKGTRPRHFDSHLDDQNARELQKSEKDKAENLMIVDLMRNDMALIATPGSVKLDALFALKSFKNVHHLISTISAKLSERDEGRGDIAYVMEKILPAGSISGAPKHQALLNIKELDAPRGAYCGVLVHQTRDGAWDSSVLIRTLSLVKGAHHWHFQASAGGGIVADSDPDEEVKECHTKLSSIKKALLG